MAACLLLAIHAIANLSIEPTRAMVVPAGMGPLARDLSFACTQIELIKCDRPDIGALIQRDQLLYFRLIWYFSRDSEGVRVYWDSREPASGWPAEHIPSYYEYPTLIRVTND